MSSRIHRTFLPSFLIALIFQCSGIVDSLMAGAFFSAMHIAAVGVALPILTFCTSLLQILVQGSYSSYASALGRAQRRKGREIFTVGFILSFGIGTLLALICIVFADGLIAAVGGMDPALRQAAVQYLRFSALSLPFVSVNRLLMLILGAYGYQKDTFAASLVNLVMNIALSALFMALYPSIGIGALGLGTLCASVPSMLVCAVAALRHHLPVSFRFRRESWKKSRMKDIWDTGIGISLNAIMDSAASGVINKIIAASALGTQGLAMYSVASIFWQLSQVTGEGMDYAGYPILSIFYACRNRTGVKRAFLTSAIGAVIYTAIWCVLLYALSPQLLSIYLRAGGEASGSPEVLRHALRILFLFSPICVLHTLLTSFFDATDSLRTSLVLAIVPDSLLLPVLIALLLPFTGYTGLWLALGGNTALFLLIAYFILMLQSRRMAVPIDTILCLDNAEKQIQHQEIDVSVRYDDEVISDLSRNIQDFFRAQEASSRVAYMTALCVDELTTDISTHTRAAEPAPRQDRSVMDVKIISEPDVFRIIICNEAAPYNPLDFEYNSEDFAKVGLMMVQRIASKIDYSYIYKMNMITIQIAKE